jgi:8-oxo-dGTP pyrophosphatase MutT (NUDIX family)
MANKKFRGLTQFAALPWRISDRGTRQVMLLTSRETHRWIIPKGWPMKKRKPAEVARQEAYEEAGLIGQIVGKRPVGNFHYAKRLAKKEVLCQVYVFSLRVERQLHDWPEKDQRETRWFDAEEAAEMVEEGGLAEIIDRFSGSCSRLIVSRNSECRARRESGAGTHKPLDNLSHSAQPAAQPTLPATRKTPCWQD